MGQSVVHDELLVLPDFARDFLKQQNEMEYNHFQVDGVVPRLLKSKPTTISS